jgi:5-methylcytosine-specific restriction protein A
MERRARWLNLHPLCCDCEADGMVTAGQEVDHVVPLWKGGADDESNFATRCIDHHAVKTAAEALERARG